MTEHRHQRHERKAEVARRIVEVGRSLHAFDFQGEQYLPRTVDDAMRDAERAFADDDFDRAEHIAKIVAFLVQRAAPKFAANPQAWVQAWQEERA